jgi:hypothetical protein
MLEDSWALNSVCLMNTRCAWVQSIELSMCYQDQSVHWVFGRTKHFQFEGQPFLDSTARPDGVSAWGQIAFYLSHPYSESSTAVVVRK